MAKKNLMETIRSVDGSSKKEIVEDVKVPADTVVEPVVAALPKEEEKTTEEPVVATEEKDFLDTLIEQGVITVEDLEFFSDKTELFEDFLKKLEEYADTITEETSDADIETSAKTIFETFKTDDKEVIKESGIQKAMKKLKESTDAASSLHPAARSVADPKSRFEYISAMVGAANAMRSDELTKWYYDSIALIGKEGRETPDASDSNKDTIDNKKSASPSPAPSKLKMPMPKLDDKGTNQGGDPGKSIPTFMAPMGKIDCKEDVAAMFEGQELTEEFKEKVTTLFEAAVNVKIDLEAIKLQESFELAYSEATDEMYNNITEQLEVYTNHVADAWLEENKLMVEQSLKAEITEEFMTGLRALFVEHNMDIPDTKVDVVEELAEKTQALEEELDSVMKKNSELIDIISEIAVESAITKASEDLTVPQKEKFAALAEGISYTGDIEQFEGKLAVIKETYFSKKVSTSNLEEETVELPETVVRDATINKYVESISRTVKK